MTQINYWKCEFEAYDDGWDGEDEHRHYGCTHPKGRGVCNLENKWAGEEDDYTLLTDDENRI
jgi:hypothetical protein